jgi:hypothetical protein
MKTYKLKHFLLLSFIVIYSLPQSELYSQTILIGIKGGLSIPQLKGGGTPQSEGYSSRLAPNFGAFINYAFNPNLSLQGEVLFSGQGGERNGMQPIFADNLTGLPVPPDIDVYADFNNETIINYLEIPVLINYSFIGHKTGFDLYIDAGPYIGILLNAKVLTNGNSKIYFDKAGTTPVVINGYPLPEQNFDNDSDITSDLKKINVGITGGLGTSFKFAGQQLNLDLRGVYGFIPIQSDDKNGSNNTGALYLTIGYGFII